MWSGQRRGVWGVWGHGALLGRPPAACEGHAWAVVGLAGWLAGCQTREVKIRNFLSLSSRNLAKGRVKGCGKTKVLPDKWDCWVGGLGESSLVDDKANAVNGMSGMI